VRSTETASTPIRCTNSLCGYRLIGNPHPAGFAAGLPGERGGESLDGAVSGSAQPPPGGFAADLHSRCESLDCAVSGLAEPPPGGFAADLPGERGGEVLPSYSTVTLFARFL